MVALFLSSVNEIAMIKHGIKLIRRNEAGIKRTYRQLTIDVQVLSQVYKS